MPSLLEEDSLCIVLGVGMPNGVEDLVDSNDGVFRLPIPYAADIWESSGPPWLFEASASHTRSGAGVAVRDLNCGVADVTVKEACAFFLSALRVTERVSS